MRFATWTAQAHDAGSNGQNCREMTEFTTVTATQKAGRARRGCFFCGHCRDGESESIDSAWLAAPVSGRSAARPPRKIVSVRVLQLAQAKRQPRQGRTSEGLCIPSFESKTALPGFEGKLRGDRCRSRQSNGSWNHARACGNRERRTQADRNRRSVLSTLRRGLLTLKFFLTQARTLRREQNPQTLGEAPQPYRHRRGDPTARLRSGAPEAQNANGSGVSRAPDDGPKPLSFPAHRSTSRICEGKRSSPRSTSADTRAPGRQRWRASRRDCDAAPPDLAPP